MVRQALSVCCSNGQRWLRCGDPELCRQLCMAFYQWQALFRCVPLRGCDVPSVELEAGVRGRDQGAERGRTIRFRWSHSDDGEGTVNTSTRRLCVSAPTDDASLQDNAF
jgi:hypothetical protein